MFLSSGWLLGGQTLATLLAIVQGILLARLLGPAGIGIVALVTTFAGLLTRFFDARSWETAVKYLTEFVQDGAHAEGRAVLKGLLVLDVAAGVLTWLVLCAAAPLATRVFIGDPVGVGLIRVYGLTVLGLAPFGMALALLRIADRYAWMSAVQAAAALIELILTIGSIWLGGTLQHLMVAFVVAALLKTVLALILMAMAARELQLQGWSRAPLRDAYGRIGEVARFWASSNAFATIKGVHQSIDTLLVGSFLGPAPAGLFRVAKNLSQAVSFPLTPLFQASYPELVRLHSGGRSDELRALYGRLLRWGAAAALGASLGVWLLASPLIRWTAGPEFLDAVPTLQWLAVGVALSAATQFGHALLMAQRRLGAVFGSFAVPLILQIAMLAALVPRYGQVAAGWAFVGFSALRSLQLLAATRGSLGSPPPGT